MVKAINKNQGEITIHASYLEASVLVETLMYFIQNNPDSIFLDIPYDLLKTLQNPDVEI